MDGWSIAPRLTHPPKHTHDTTPRPHTDLPSLGRGEVRHGGVQEAEAEHQPQRDDGQPEGDHLHGGVGLDRWGGKGVQGWMDPPSLQRSTSTTNVRAHSVDTPPKMPCALAHHEAEPLDGPGKPLRDRGVAVESHRIRVVVGRPRCCPLAPLAGVRLSVLVVPVLCWGVVYICDG